MDTDQRRALKRALGCSPTPAEADAFRRFLFTTKLTDPDEQAREFLHTSSLFTEKRFKDGDLVGTIDFFDGQKPFERKTGARRTNI